MKKLRIINLLLAIAILITTLLLTPIYGYGSKVPGYKTLKDAAKGKTLLPNAKFVDGGEAFGDTDEVPENLFDDDLTTKYNSNEMPYWAEWKYEKSYIADRLIIATANDSEEYPRRMASGWTLSGSTDGKTWKVIYKGKSGDYRNTNFTYYIIDLENKTAYNYYMLEAKEGADSDTIQLSEIALCGKAPQIRFKTLEDAAKGKTLLTKAKFVAGGSGIAGSSETPENLFDNDLTTKYCADELPYWVEWKYEKPCIADRLIFATAEDSEEYHRRMADGWTLSGSDDCMIWKTIYTGKASDYENINTTYYRIDLKNNKTAYLYYKLEAKKSAETDTIQLSEIALCGTVKK